MTDPKPAGETELLVLATSFLLPFALAGLRPTGAEINDAANDLGRKFGAVTGNLFMNTVSDQLLRADALAKARRGRT